MADTYVAPGDIDIYEVLAAEIVAINGRRAKKARPLLPIGTIYHDHQNVLEAVGLALSGGGIRSAAFSLGVLQALNQHGVIDRVDYLSTVSGGGYIGASMTASMSVTGGKFAFGTKSEQGGAPLTADVADTDAVAHIRNYSNYLIPFGLGDVLSALAIIVRGLVANLAWLLPRIMLLAAFTIFIWPTRIGLSTPLIAQRFGAAHPGSTYVTTTIALVLIGIAGALVWAIYRSRLKPDKLAEFRQGLPAFGGWVLALIGVVLVVELQPLVLSQMFDVADKQAASGGTGFGGLIGRVVDNWIQSLTAFSASLWVVVKFFQDHFESAIETGGKSERWRTWLAGVTAQATVWIAAAALPLIIWLAYLYLSFWGIADGPQNHAPGWMAAIARGVVGIGLAGPGTGIFWLYVVVGVALWLVARLWLKPNVNSLHRLYRDRISKAFLFNPDEREDDGRITGARDLKALDAFPLADLSLDDAPYHLINATLNIQGVDFANRRGRDADFFLISARHVGSIATGYAPTERVAAQQPDFDLGTAIAISGAAASAEMGSRTIRVLTPTLALLNVRLAYWLTNPCYLRDPSRQFTWEDEQRADLQSAEIFGRLNETDRYVYLSDGGHIENLGLYELLRRKCRLIIVVDCDQDGEMTMPSFVAVQRYARIDLGIRISLPWQKIAESTRAWMGVGAPGKNKPEDGATKGPHVAIGKIDYGAGEAGYLVYVKPSLTGDENDYISDYARCHADYPHESTGDQFFSEEQFEVYRALGFHAIFGFLSGSDDVVVHGELLTSDRPAAQRSAGSETAAAVFTVLPMPQPEVEPPKHPPVVDDHQVMSGKDQVLEPIRALLGLAG